jgi:MED6 mediator sub complex component
MYYSYEKVHDGYFIIKKEYIEGSKRIMQNHYIVMGNKIFNAPNLKDVLKSKIENIANILSEMENVIVSDI